MLDIRPGSVGYIDGQNLVYVAPGHPWFSTVVMFATFYWRKGCWHSYETSEPVPTADLPLESLWQLYK